MNTIARKWKGIGNCVGTSNRHSPAIIISLNVFHRSYFFKAKIFTRVIEQISQYGYKKFVKKR